MTLEDQLRAILDEEADMRTATPPDLSSLISGGQARRRRRNAAWTVGGVLAAVIAVGGAYGVAQLGGDDGAATYVANQPTPRPLPETSAEVAIDAGTYVVPAGSDVVMPYQVTVPAGWDAQHGTNIVKRQDQEGAAGLQPFALDRIRLTADTCRGPEILRKPQTGVTGLVAGLRAQGSRLRVSDPVADTVGGLPATRIDLGYPSATPLSGCRLPRPGAQSGWLQVWSGYFVMFPRSNASVYVVALDGREQLFVTTLHDGASARDRAQLRSILDSISFQPDMD